jgi:hypothetical protein
MLRIVFQILISSFDLLSVEIDGALGATTIKGTYSEKLGNKATNFKVNKEF